MPGPLDDQTMAALQKILMEDSAQRSRTPDPSPYDSARGAETAYMMSSSPRANAVLPESDRPADRPVYTDPTSTWGTYSPERSETLRQAANRQAARALEIEQYQEFIDSLLNAGGRVEGAPSQPRFGR